MEQIWESSQGPKKPLLPSTILGMSGNLLKSVVLALVGVALQFALFLFKRRKARRLDMIEKQEEEEAKERGRIMEEQWRLAEEEQKSNVPDFILPKS